VGVNPTVISSFFVQKKKEAAERFPECSVGS
jgi:hypothetical protein